MDKPTELTKADIDAFVERLMTEEIKFHDCPGCSKQCLPNYDFYLCDECFFGQFPKEQVTKFYESIVADML